MAGSGLGSSSIYAEVAAERPRTNDTSLPPSNQELEALFSSLGVVAAGQDHHAHQHKEQHHGVKEEGKAERDERRRQHRERKMEKSGSDAANNTFPSPPLVGPPLGLSLSPRCDDAGDGELDRDAWYLSAYGKELCLSVRAVKGEGCPCLMRTVSVSKLSP